jgi:hypothetical protein
MKDDGVIPKAKKQLIELYVKCVPVKKELKW